ncbi:MAG: NTP transferase domain-containing protein [Pseudomonadota bacterium]
MKALILAAGLGSRLGDLTNNKPKALTKVAGKELISYVLDFLDHEQITQKAVVTGYQADKLKAYIQTHSAETQILFNPNFKLGSIYTLETGLSFLDDDFLLINVDHIYPKRMLTSILNKAHGITAICDFDRTLVADDMKIKLANNSLLNIKKTLTDYDGGYIGMTYCAATHIGIYKEAIQETKKIHGDLAPVEWVLQTLANKQHKISICDVSGFGWLEVDNNDDLQQAENTLKTNKDFLK